MGAGTSLSRTEQWTSTDTSEVEIAGYKERGVGIPTGEDPWNCDPSPRHPTTPRLRDSVGEQSMLPRVLVIGGPRGSGPRGVG